MSAIDTRITSLIAFALIFTSACAATAPRGPVAAVAFADADSITSAVLADGVAYTFVRDARGPWAIHVVEIDIRRCDPVLQARKPGPALDERATTSALTGSALAGINADFFMLPGGTPVGAHVTGGVPLIGPTDRPVFGATRDGWRIGTARVVGHAHSNADSAAMAQVNRPARALSGYSGTRSGLTLFTSWIGDSVPADSAARRITMRVLRGDEAAGVGVVTASDSTTSATALGSGAVVLLAHGPDRAWAHRRTAGDTVRWTAEVVIGPGPRSAANAPVTEAVGGFPELLRGGRMMLPEQTVAESFARRRHPRTAVGWSLDRRLILVAVDGRQPHWSDGMSLDELTWLFQTLGASDALNLDGGGSTALVVSGSVVSRPSDHEGERAVGNAIALAGCR